MNVFDPSEQRATQADAGGDADQIVEGLYALYKERLLRVILWRLWRGETGPESLVQYVFMSVARRIRCSSASDLKDDELRRLLFRIALRHCNNANHRTKWARDHGQVAVQFSQQGDEQEGGYDPPDKGESALEWLERQDWVEQIRDRLVKKGFDERELCLFGLMLDGHTIEEMAEMTGLRVGRVRDRRIRILRVVKACFEEALDEPGAT